jgi:hypothetical protein
MTEYTIKYEYEYIDHECPCCAYSDKTITIYENNRTDGVYTSSFDTFLIAEDENVLREFINDYYPEYNDFSVHEDTRWF